MWLSLPLPRFSDANRAKKIEAVFLKGVKGMVLPCKTLANALGKNS